MFDERKILRVILTPRTLLSSCCSWCSPWCSLSNAGDAEKTENHCGHREFSHRLFLYMYPLEGRQTSAKAGKWSNLYDYKSSGFHLFVVTQYLLRCCYILCGVRAPVFYEIVAISVCQIKAFHIGILQNEKVFLQAVKISDSDR